MNLNTVLLVDGSLMLIGLINFTDDPEELAYYNKIRKEMDDMKKEPIKKGIPLNWDTLEGMNK